MKFSDAFEGEEGAYKPSAFEDMKKGPSDEEGDSDSELNEGHHAAAREMMDAHTNNDHKAYAAALKSFMDCSK